MPPLKTNGVPDYSRGFPIFQQTRSWDLDYTRLVNSNVQQQSDSKSQATPAATSANHVPDGTPTDFRNMPAGGGPKAKLIVDTAFRLMQTHPSSTDYYFQPEVACASFVSTVLEVAKIIPPSPLLSNTHVGDPRRYCPTLAAELTRLGAVQIIRGNLPLTEENLTRTLIPGDIIFYYRARTGRFGHVEVYVGGGKTVGNSSSRKQVTNHSAVSLRGTYQSFSGWRFA